MIKRLHLFINSDNCRFCMVTLAGLAFGLVIGLAAGGAVQKGCPVATEAPFGCVEFVLFRYQTLVAGMFALIGAWLLWVQIQDQRQQALRKQRQGDIAARIKMPHALAQMSVYLKHCYDAWEGADIEGRTMGPPNEALAVIMAAASSADKDTFETIKHLTTLSQAFEARLRPLHGLGRRERLRQMIVDIAELLYLTDSLYSYGRLEVDSAPYVRPDRDALEDKIKGINRYRIDADLRPIQIRMNEAFDRRFGRRTEAVEVLDDNLSEIYSE